jgi:CheY-like chemotaxis protein
MRIIFADGHDNFRKVVVELLRDEGHVVHPVKHGGELVKMARSVFTNVIVTHARFDDLPTLQALELIVAAGVHVPTILMSADVRQIAHDEARRLGVVGYLEKPFAMPDLRTALRSASRFTDIAI